MYHIEETIINYVKNGNRWTETDRATSEISQEYHHNATAPETIKFFRNLGGYERAEKSYTRAGYVVTRVTSINPTRTEKTVREYNFI